MPIPLSPELALVLPEAQREAAIRALPAPPVWNPGPLGPAIVAPQQRAPQHRGIQRRTIQHRAIQHRAIQGLLVAALLYFAVRFVWTVATAAVYVVTIVGVVILLTLIF